jgi:uncharacterized protein involved in cysteine biosynthesis
MYKVDYFLLKNIIELTIGLFPYLNSTLYLASLTLFTSQLFFLTEYQ